MAINTKARRASVQAYTLGLMRPPPAGVVGPPARAAVAWLYGGIDYLTDSRDIHRFNDFISWFYLR